MEHSRGLLCSGTTVFNPSLGISKKLPPFPLEAFPVKSKVKTFIGFDPRSGRYKVLGMSKEVGLPEEKVYNHQILTLEMEGSSPWRQLNCNIQHSLFRFAVDCKSVCIGDHLFYVAVLPDNECSVMNLNMTTERFGTNIVPEVPLLGLYYHLGSGLYNFKGKLGVCFCDGLNHRVHILEDMVNNVWSSFLVEPPQCILQQLGFLSRFSFEGFTRRGDRVFSEVEATSLYLYYYDVSTGEAEKILVQQPTLPSPCRFFFWNHLESFMLCTFED